MFALAIKIQVGKKLARNVNWTRKCSSLGIYVYSTQVHGRVYTHTHTNTIKIESSEIRWFIKHRARTDVVLYAVNGSS